MCVCIYKYTLLIYVFEMQKRDIFYLLVYSPIAHKARNQQGQSHGPEVHLGLPQGGRGLSTWATPGSEVEQLHHKACTLTVTCGQHVFFCQGIFPSHFNQLVHFTSQPQSSLNTQSKLVLEIECKREEGEDMSEATRFSHKAFQKLLSCIQLMTSAFTWLPWKHQSLVDGKPHFI